MKQSTFWIHDLLVKHFPLRQIWSSLRYLKQHSSAKSLHFLVSTPTKSRLQKVYSSRAPKILSANSQNSSTTPQHVLSSAVWKLSYREEDFANHSGLKIQCCWFGLIFLTVRLALSQGYILLYLYFVSLSFNLLLINDMQKKMCSFFRRLSLFSKRVTFDSVKMTKRQWLFLTYLSTKIHLAPDFLKIKPHLSFSCLLLSDDK